MPYPFPVIENLDDILPAISGRDEFRVVEKDDYLVVNYFVNLVDSFPDPNKAKNPEESKLWALRRECRGIIFDANTRKIIRRVYPKFFNVNEKDETRAEKIDLSQPHIILQKVDGSLIAPFWSRGNLIFGTKLGLTDVSKLTSEFLEENPHYVDWSASLLESGYTPLFEFASRKQRIVIDYPEDHLILTGVRNTITGEFVSYPDMLEYQSDGIEVVTALEGKVTNMNKFLGEVKDLKDEEGYVIRFNTGMMYKIKAEEYLRIHGTKDMLNLEKNVIENILSEKVDDTLPFMMPEDRVRVESFQRDLHKNIHETSERLKWIVIAAKDNLNKSKKRFAIEVVNQHPTTIEKSLLFRIWDAEEGDEFKIVADTILKNTGSQTNVDSVRSLFGGLSWYKYKQVPEVAD